MNPNTFDNLDLLVTMNADTMPITLDELATRTGRSIDAMKKRMQRLTKDGYVTASRDKEWQGQNQYTLTAKGMHAHRVELARIDASLEPPGLLASTMQRAIEVTTLMHLGDVTA